MKIVNKQYETMYEKTMTKVGNVKKTLGTMLENTSRKHNMKDVCQMYEKYMKRV